MGGLPQSKPFVQPSFSNQAKLSTISETFRIGVTACASMVVALWWGVEFTAGPTSASNS